MNITVETGLETAIEQKILRLLVESVRLDDFPGQAPQKMERVVAHVSEICRLLEIHI
jgi:hypothetical protein